MKFLPIIGSTQLAVVDDEDFERLSKFRWKITSSSNHIMRRYDILRHTNYISIANEILSEYPSNCLIDHKDRNPFNNQKDNLRPCNRAQNCSNRRGSVNSTSQYKGVCLYRKSGKWQVQLKKNGKVYCGGYFSDEIAAAKAYDTLAKVHHGEFAYLNFP